MSRVRWTRRLRVPAALCAILALTLALLDRLYPPNLPDQRTDYARVVTDRDGVPLRVFPDARGVWRYATTPAAVAPQYLEALVAYEDRWFWHHPGINPASIARAAWQNARSGRVISGGSTLTQQVARLLHPRPRTLRGKVGETLRALQLEWRLSKREILTLYLNHAPFGGTLEGVQAASYAYLGKSAAQLTDAEAALLAVLPQAPSRLRPDRHPDRAQRARDKVLQRLADHEVWSPERVTDALSEWVVARRLQQPIRAPLLARRLIQEKPQVAVIATSIDGDLQSSLEFYVKDYSGRFPAPVSAAVLVLESETMAVRAYLGSADFLDSERAGHVDMIRAIRSPGSTLKPFVFGFALDEGLIHSQSLLVDAPRARASYRPTNFGGGFTGPVSVTQALRLSLNLPAVQVLESLGPGQFADRLANAGLKLHIPEGEPSLALALGGAGVRLESLAGVFAALSRKGLASPPRYRVEGDQPASKFADRRLLSPGAAWIVRRMLTSETDAGFASRRVVGWKTGTSYGYRDAWALGFDGKHTVAVWVGRPDGTPVPGQTGAGAAVPLLRGVMEHLPAPDQSFPLRPENVVREDICWPLGTRRDTQASHHCQQSRRAWLLDGAAPPTLSGPGESLARNPVSVWRSPDSGALVSAECRTADDIGSQVALWPRALEPWIASEARRKAMLGSPDVGCEPYGLAATSPVIEGLLPGAVWRATLGDLPVVQLHSRGGVGRQRWFVNGRYAKQTDSGDIFAYSMTQPGRYQFAVVDQSGATDKVALSVLSR